MIRKSVFAIAASLMTLSAFSGTLAVMKIDGVQPAGQAAIA